MRPIRFLILLLVLATAMLVALVRPLPSQAGDTSTSGKHRRHTTRRRHLASTKVNRTSLGGKVVQYARRFIGTPYAWGGTSPRYGFDCSGFVRYVYAHFGVSLPHSSFGDLWRGRRISRHGLRPGDLVFFAGASHVGIYVGGNRFIDAPHTGTVVRISTMNGWYGYEYYGARRLRPGT